MGVDQTRSKRKPSGARYKSQKPKRKYRLGSTPTMTKIDKVKTKQVKVIGGNKKSKILAADIANVYDKKTKKYVKAKIIQVLENPANRHYVRRNILTKGTVIKTDKGDAKITNRPGQEGAINAVLV